MDGQQALTIIELALRRIRDRERAQNVQDLTIIRLTNDLADEIYKIASDRPSGKQDEGK